MASVLPSSPSPPRFSPGSHRSVAGSGRPPAPHQMERESPRRSQLGISPLAMNGHDLDLVLSDLRNLQISPCCPGCKRTERLCGWTRGSLVLCFCRPRSCCLSLDLRSMKRPRDFARQWALLQLGTTDPMRSARHRSEEGVTTAGSLTRP